MEKKVNYQDNGNGTYTKTVITKTNPNDGFVHQADINKTDITNYGEYHKGWQVNKHFETNDPKKVKLGLAIMILFSLVILAAVFYFFYSFGFTGR